MISKSRVGTVGGGTVRPCYLEPCHHTSTPHKSGNMMKKKTANETINLNVKGVLMFGRHA